MSEVRLLPRFSVALLAAAVAVLFGCTGKKADTEVPVPAAPTQSATVAPTPPVASTSDCPNGSRGWQNRDSPVICVDNTGTALSVDPESADAWDVDSVEGKPVMIQWVTMTKPVDPSNPTKKVDLDIEMVGQNCVEPAIVCNGGRCIARTKKVTVKETCKYKVILAGFQTLDPDVVITKCCTP